MEHGSKRISSEAIRLALTDTREEEQVHKTSWLPPASGQSRSIMAAIFLYP